MDERELRTKLTDLLEEGYDPKLVTESMFSVALARLGGNT